MSCHGMWVSCTYISLHFKVVKVQRLTVLPIDQKAVGSNPCAAKLPLLSKTSKLSAPTDLYPN